MKAKSDVMAQAKRRLRAALSETVTVEGSQAVQRVMDNRREVIATWRKHMKTRACNTTEIWKSGLELMELAVTQAACCSEQFDSMRPERFHANFTAISRLFSEAVNIASEVLLLLRNGFASGAHARWRSLYERAVIALFLAHSVDSTSKKFLDHEIVKNYELLSEAQRFCSMTGLKPLPAARLQKCMNALERVVQRYGSDFAGKYGWAKPALAKRFPARKGGVTFDEITRACGLEFMKSPYGLASHAVHATPVSVRAWAESEGLVTSGEPAVMTILSLIHCTDAAHICVPRLMRRAPENVDALMELIDASVRFSVALHAFQTIAFKAIDILNSIDDVENRSRDSEA